MLHGQPVKAGDRVWGLYTGWVTVLKVDGDVDPDFIDVDGSWRDKETFFWNEITPSLLTQHHFKLVDKNKKKMESFTQPGTIIR